MAPTTPLRFPYRHELRLPVIGLEAEFKVFVDDEEAVPEELWRTPYAFIEAPLLHRGTKAAQLPTGGAVYFDGGVLEVVTPVIEIGEQSTPRAVRSLWEQIAFIRAELDRWETRSGKRARLQGFSCHFNISYEIAREERNRNRTIQKLALLLAHLLPAPVIVTGANRESTGVGVRPRRDRIEITFDFTPDPALMAATTAVVVGIVRDVIAWPSYRVEEIAKRNIPVIAGLNPGRHTTRHGWIARAFHFPHDPFACDINAPIWSGEKSLRQIAHDIASHFRKSIRGVSDEQSENILFSVLRGETKSLLDLEKRPDTYDDIGRAVRWPDSTPPLPRSRYERVFLGLGTRQRVKIGDEWLTPVGVKGWYHATFKDAHGEEQLLSIDQLADLFASS
jgi:hypothetical protein